MIDPSEKLSNDHAHDTQSFCLPNAILQLREHGSEPTTIGKLESFAVQLIERLAQRSSMQSVISSAAAVLQSADEMKMAELNDPASTCTELDNTRNLVENSGAIRLSHPNDWNGCERRGTNLACSLCLCAAPDRGRCSILMTWFYRHHIQNPIFSSKAKIKSGQDQNQRSFRQAQSPEIAM